MEKKYVKEVSKLKKKPGIVPYHHSVARYSIVFDNDGKVVNVPNSNYACHAGLRSPRYTYPHVIPATAKPIAIINALGDLRVKKETASRFLEWFLNYSPYQEAWHTKSPRTALKDGIIVGNTNVPNNLVGGAMFASRSLWEHDARVAKIWEAFVNYGLHPDIAFLLGHVFNISDENNIHLEYINWHVAIDGASVNPSHVVNFLTGNRRDNPSYEVTATYENIHSTWTKANKAAGGIEVTHSKFLAAVKAEEKDKKVNPFKKKKGWSC